MTQPLTLPLTAPDLVALEDLDAFASETASDLETLEQDVLHILIEEPGSNPDDESRGVGIYDLLGGTETDLANAEQRINTALEADERIDAADTTITKDADGAYLITIDITVDGVVVTLDFTLPTGGELTAS